VAIKIKGSQGQPRVEWLNVEHPWTALSAIAEVHANHLEAFNSALRRRATAYRRRQNHYAKQVEGLQRALDVQRLMHNWVRPHWSLGKQTTPAMAMGFIQRPLKLSEILVFIDCRMPDLPLTPKSTSRASSSATYRTIDQGKRKKNIKKIG
jgi:hypothetical protein